MLDEVGGLTVEGCGRGSCIKYLKSGWNKKSGGGETNFKKGVMLGK